MKKEIFQEQKRQAKNLLLDKTCDTCFFHNNRNKPVTIFCLKEVETDYNTCENWESQSFNDYNVFRGTKLTTRSDVEFAEKEIEKIKNRHRL